MCGWHELGGIQRPWSRIFMLALLVSSQIPLQRQNLVAAGHVADVCFVVMDCLLVFSE